MDPDEHGSPQAGPASVRVDVWLWAVRIFKTRSAATAACKAGHVKIDGDRAKPAQRIHVGDQVRVRTDRDRILVAQQLLKKRVGAPIAAKALIDNSPPPPPREFAAPIAFRDRGAGRPTKRERREIDRIRGRDIEPEPWGAEE
ncbi:RNA-binding S4 domain-containing protein [Pseudoclavibacter terrae]|uniref:RNA-binding S4 domain-containing protein n=1 Tax=Pseudoclavibacter terrae TaxID=1530195 RepID=UPI00232AE1DB|nr:RNA-binding S4 domain-containing protein [Pseudoclavibacter terrae]